VNEPQDLLLDLDDLDTKRYTTYSDPLSSQEDPAQSLEADEQALSGKACSCTLVENVRTDSASLQNNAEDTVFQGQVAGTDTQDKGLRAGIQYMARLARDI
jgi:hypothetical protein